MKIAVIVFPASNCDRDVAVALERITGTAPDMVWHADAEFGDYDLLVLPGGFSYGDYLRAGAMAANAPAMRALKDHAGKGKPVLGICNGFQVLCEARLLPGVLMRNRDLKFLCRDVFLRVERNDTAYANRYAERQVIRIPIAHHDGNYFADGDTLDALEDGNRVAFRYCAEDGSLDEAHNPNGSARQIAGIYSENGNVLGMMPHPERLCEPAHGGTDGRLFFESILSALS